mmetsp:Transcript_18067/g.36663  ORF Transcript_18067/g.36663 Transcript_18067/m.36663 type:complete len:85 (-) Transcript_18067:1512-1766(-)
MTYMQQSKTEMAVGGQATDTPAASLCSTIPFHSSPLDPLFRADRVETGGRTEVATLKDLPAIRLSPACRTLRTTERPRTAPQKP